MNEWITVSRDELLDGQDEPQSLREEELDEN